MDLSALQINDMGIIFVNQQRQRKWTHFKIQLTFLKLKSFNLEYNSRDSYPVTILRCTFSIIHN